MAYWWKAELVPGADTAQEDLTSAGLGNRFDDQVAAEEWLSTFYPDLQELGVRLVSLCEGDRLVYGPMALGE